MRNEGRRFIMDITVKKVQSKFVIGFLVIFVAQILLSVIALCNIFNDWSADINPFLDSRLWFYITSVPIYLVGIVLFIISIVTTALNTYVFTEYKLIVKSKQKVKKEISYSAIEKVKINDYLESMSIYYRKQLDDNGKKSKSKRIWGYFTKNDLGKIKEKLTTYNAENGGKIQIV